VWRLASVGGVLPREGPLAAERPIRTPLPSLSVAELVGDARYLRPGEVSLAHHGVLLLDDLSSLTAAVGAALLTPLEEGYVRLGTGAGEVTFPARFQLLAARPPCPCGRGGDPASPCGCTPRQRAQDLQRIPRALLDRIELHVDGTHPPAPPPGPGSPGAEVRARVQTALAAQANRFGLRRRGRNGELSPTQVRRFCPLDEEGQSVLRTASERQGLTAQGYQRVLTVARTIADLDGVDEISRAHLAEALSFRPFPLPS
jgi:magnesium chelatase family protein